VCSPRNSIPGETVYNKITVFEILKRSTSDAKMAEGFKMKKLVLALTAVAALSGTASAADLAARPYTKAAPMAVAPSWTGFYIFGGAGGGVWDADTGIQGTASGAPILGTNQKQGGDGWYGTVGAGYDWQYSSSWVFGIFADGQFGSIKGTIQDQGPFIAGSEKMKDAWAAGARLGYLVAPNVLSYVNGGYGGSYWSGTTLLGTGTGLPSGLHTNKFNTEGFFVGGGVENNLNIFGITAPGWFMKTEYRAAYYDHKNVSELFDGTNLSNGRDITFHPLVQTISTSLVYRFNWGGPVVAKY
jgi:outer membrane immunogenic protein